MEVKTERSIAYGILVVCMLLGVVCYGAFPERVPDEPVRLMFKSTAGRVLFDHKGHFSESGYGFDCGLCHHEDEDDPQACGQCHEGETDVGRADAFHGQCKGCHEEEQAGPIKCSGCHVL